MKVLVFTNLYPNNIAPNYGVFVKERMIHFAKLEGCEVKVVAPVPYYPPIRFGWRSKLAQVSRREIRDGIEVFHPRYFMTPKIGMLLYGWMMFWSVLSEVKKIQRDFDFDLIDAHYVYPDGFAAVKLGRFFNKPVVVSARGSDINLFKTFPLIRMLLSYVLRKADRVVAVSQALKIAMIELGLRADKIETIPNGIDTTKFYPLAKDAARKELGLPNSTTIISVGSLTDNKGFEILIRSVRRIIQSSIPNLQLLIIGDGPSRKKLEKTIASLQLNDHVRLVGAVPHDKLRLWYCAADVFCLASEREGWPNVVLESLACGTPVVATSVGGIPEIVQSQKIGLLTKRDEMDIAFTLTSALQRTWEPKDIVDYAAKNSWHGTAAVLFKVFQSLVRQRGDLSRTVTESTATSV
jgi:teichuronic acid biosynthesis glycosyltransferase TuaC